MKFKKFVFVPLIVLLCVIVYALVAKPTIAKHTWVLSYAQQAEPPFFVVAHNEDYDFSDVDSSLFEFSQPIELTLEAKDRKLILTDTTNGKTYEGTYKVKSWNRFANQSYLVFVDGMEGTANVISESGRQLFIAIGDYELYFAIR